MPVLYFMSLQAHTASVPPVCYKEEDFPPFEEGNGLSELDYAEYMQGLLGSVVPEQYISDAALLGSGYSSWQEYLIFAGMWIR